MKRFLTLRDVHIRLGRPHREAPARGVIFKGFVVAVDDAPVAGEVIDGIGTWYRDGDDYYWGGALKPVAGGATGTDGTPPAAPGTAGATRYKDWRTSLAGVPAAWLAHDGAGVRVAVIDSGITHPDLAHTLAPDDQSAFGGEGLEDREGHGTGIAGLLAARPPDRRGVRGVAPGVALINANVYGRSGPETPAIVRALRWCLERGADVVSLSLGSLKPETDPDLEALIRTHTRQGVVFVASAGVGKAIHRSGRDLLIDRIYTPARLEDCLAVGAVSETFRDDFFRLGDVRFAPGLDFVAPFVPLYTTDIARRGGFSERQGSSFAAPVVAGLAALVIEAFALPRSANRTALIREKLAGIAGDLRHVGFSTTPYHPVVRTGSP